MENTKKPGNLYYSNTDTTKNPTLVIEWKKSIALKMRCMKWRGNADTEKTFIEENIEITDDKGNLLLCRLCGTNYLPGAKFQAIVAGQVSNKIIK
jgi:peptide-methionine (R)-S-oxide reductase